MKKKTKILKATSLISLFLLSYIPLEAQTIGISTNTLEWITLSPNIGIEAGIGRHWSVSLDAVINPFSYNEGKKTQIWLVQPEVRYWTRHKFSGHVLGIHGQYGQYNWALSEIRYRGDLKGGGISYGYAYMINEKWNIEASLGIGYNRLNYINRYDRYDDEKCFGPSSKNYWGITRASVKFTYFIR